MDFNNNLITLPFYLHQNILKYCWYDDCSTFKWKLSLSLLSKKHFDYISKLNTTLNYSLFKDNQLLVKLKNNYNCFKYPLVLKCSLNQLYSFVRSYYINSLLSISEGNLKGLHLKLDEPLHSQDNSNETFKSLIPSLIEDSKELELFSIKSLFNFINDYQEVLWDPLMKQNYLKELSFMFNNFNIEQFAKFIKDYSIKNQKFNQSGLERISLKISQGGDPVIIDKLPLYTLNSVTSLHFSNIIINEPSKFIESLSNLNNLNDLSIDSINLQQLQVLSIKDYQEIFNSLILKFLKNKPHQIKILNLPFPIENELLAELSSDNQSVNSLSIIPNSMVSFNKSLVNLTLKSGYSASTFQQFCELNQNNSSIQNLTINNNQQFPNYLVYIFNSFIKYNNNLSKLNINQSFSLLELESIFKAINNNNTIHTLTIQISENSPQFNNTNYLFYLLSSENTCINVLNLKIFHIFQVKSSFIESKQFSLISQKDNYKFKYLRNN